MRKSTRIASSILQNAAKSVPKKAKRSRESTPSISELEQSASNRKPATKRVKTETNSPLNDDKKDSKSSLVDDKALKHSSPARKTRKVGKKVKQERDSDAKEQKVESSLKLETSSPKILPPSDNKKLIGAHVSISGGLCNAVYSAVEIGAKAFAMFLRSQRQWKSKPLDEKTAQNFREACASHGFSPSQILPHGIYLMNCGSPDEETLAKSREVLIEELQRCEMLGLTLYNFHPGSTCGKIPVDECLDKIAESINIAHSKTKYVITVIENMSCQGNTVSLDTFLLYYLPLYLKEEFFCPRGISPIHIHREPIAKGRLVCNNI